MTKEGALKSSFSLNILRFITIFKDIDLINKKYSRTLCITILLLEGLNIITRTTESNTKCR